MSKYVKLAAAAAVAMGLSFGVAATPASALQIELDVVFSGSTPPGPSPWLELEFSQHSDDVVLLTMQAKLTGDTFISQVYINLLTAFVQDPDLSVDHSSGTEGTAQVGLDSFKADGDGLFDILFSFPTASGPGRFEGTETSSWLISAAGLTPSAFESFSAPQGPEQGPFKDGLIAAAHLQGFGASGWITEFEGNGIIPIPLPAGLLLFLSGLVGIGVLGRYKAKRGEVASA